MKNVIAYLLSIGSERYCFCDESFESVNVYSNAGTINNVIVP